MSLGLTEPTTNLFRLSLQRACFFPITGAHPRMSNYQASTYKILLMPLAVWSAALPLFSACLLFSINLTGPSLSVDSYVRPETHGIFVLRPLHPVPSYSSIREGCDRSWAICGPWMAGGSRLAVLVAGGLVR